MSRTDARSQQVSHAAAEAAGPAECPYGGEVRHGQHRAAGHGGGLSEGVRPRRRLMELSRGLLHRDFPHAGERSRRQIRIIVDGEYIVHGSKNGLL